MNIIGIGIDIIEIKRIKKIKSRIKKKISKKILTKYEYKKYKTEKNKNFFLAKILVAKEATSKALGIGMRRGVNFNNFIIYHNKIGKPKVKLIKKASKIFKNIKKKIHISITDEKKYAQAIVIVEKI